MSDRKQAEASAGYVLAVALRHAGMTPPGGSEGWRFGFETLAREDHAIRIPGLKVEQAASLGAALSRIGLPVFASGQPDRVRLGADPVERLVRLARGKESGFDPEHASGVEAFANQIRRAAGLEAVEFRPPNVARRSAEIGAMFSRIVRPERTGPPLATTVTSHRFGNRSVVNVLIDSCDPREYGILAETLRQSGFDARYDGRSFGLRIAGDDVFGRLSAMSGDASQGTRIGSTAAAEILATRYAEARDGTMPPTTADAWIERLKERARTETRGRT